MHQTTSGRAERSGISLVLAIVERLADGVVIVDDQGIIRFANPAAERIFGRSTEELVGREFGFAVVPDETVEIEIVRSRGLMCAAELRVVEIDWRGKPASLVSIRDVTDRNEADAKRRELARAEAARMEAEAASQAKSEFLAVMSHELRTPLNAVLGYAELLDLGIGGTLSAEQRQQLGRIRASGQHLLALVNEVLDLARVEAGRLSVDRIVKRVADATDGAIMMVESQASSKGVTIRRVPDPDPDRLYVGDEDRVRQVLVNLLTNAVKFTGSGGKITIESGTTDSPDPEGKLHGSAHWTFIRVSDTGVGIPPDRIETIFAPFTQLQTGHTRGVDGSGLGLTISRRLARLMGGDITVRSRVGDGSAFTLWLPEPSADASAPTLAKRRLSLSGRDPRVKGLAEVGESLLRETEGIVDAFVARLRTDERVQPARALTFSQLSDHVATLLADIFNSLVALEESGGLPTVIITDGADIQQLIADRHGVQRAMLHWTTDAVRHEHEILREEVERAIHRCFHGENTARIEEGIQLVHRMLEQAQETAIRAMERSEASRDDT